LKTRESGMPDEPLWASFFQPDEMLTKLALTPDCGDVADFGCGYGTFTIPAARLVHGTVHTFDIEADMVDATTRKAAAADLTNVRVTLRDFMTHGTGLPDASMAYAMLFNILHCEEPMTLLREARRILQDDGVLAIMHWKHDASTPRGPSMAIRPRPEQCRTWAEQAGFRLAGSPRIDLPPYHYGLVLQK
jgi:ubiquinone/menaquinone biosynthesis C-methylase UbiE